MKNGLAKVSREADGFRLVIEREFNHDIETVWNAITNPEKLKIWFTRFEMDFRPGGKMTIWFQDKLKTATYGEIVTIEPPHKFVYTWEGELAVWELKENGKNKCRLTLTYSKLSEQYALSAPAGFHAIIDQLEQVLDGRTEAFAFGTEEIPDEHLRLQQMYAPEILEHFPELKRYEPIIIEKTYNATIDRVWRAITDKSQMKQWYFDLNEFKPEEGFEFRFAGTGHKGEKYIHLCKITDVVTERRLTYSWRYQGFEGDSSVTFELFPEGDKTRLRLTHRGLGSFPEDNPDFARESFMGGWTELINVLLKKFLDDN